MVFRAFRVICIDISPLRCGLRPTAGSTPAATRAAALEGQVSELWCS